MNQSVVSFFLGHQFFGDPISMSNSSLCVHVSNDISVLDGGKMVVMLVQPSLNRPRDKEPWVRLLDLKGRVRIKGRDQPKDLCAHI